MCMKSDEKMSERDEINWIWDVNKRMMKIYAEVISDMRIWMKIEDLEKDLENLKGMKLKKKMLINQTEVEALEGAQMN